LFLAAGEGVPVLKGNNMQIWNSIEEAGREVSAFDTNTYSVVTIGNFDGVHQGHQAIIGRVVELARAKKLLSMVLTFTNHTGSLFGKRPPLLNQPDFRRELLQRQGLNALLEVEFDETVAKLSPERFFEEWLVEHLRVRNIVIGHDFKFGVKGSGDYRLLRKLAAEHPIEIEQIPPVLHQGTVISSSRIRHLIRHGHIEAANECLGYPFSVTGTVVTGEQRGRGLGFPTANIYQAPEYLLPAYGVYLVTFTVAGRAYDGIASVGVKPTFGVYDPLIEVHLFDVNLDLYRQTARVEFIRFIRPEVRFHNSNELREQIVKDIETAKGWIGPGFINENRLHWLKKR
jgi:riboflavin kinase/FMN adenylyltransferase